MVNFAKVHYPPEQFPNLALMQTDAGELPFDSEYDIIFSNAALHWIKGSEPVLKGFSRSLRTEGTLLAQFGGRENAAEILKIIDSMLEDEK